MSTSLLLSVKSSASDLVTFIVVIVIRFPGLLDGRLQVFRCNRFQVFIRFVLL